MMNLREILSTFEDDNKIVLSNKNITKKVKNYKNVLNKCKKIGLFIFNFVLVLYL